MTRPKARTELQRRLAKVPLFVSYLILGSTWATFIVVISIHEILFRRHEIWRFAEQIIIVNALFLLTLISLITTSSRPAGKPDQSLVPLSAAMDEKETPARFQAVAGKDDDDIPLRYLRNSSWLNGRVSKDRPSPLPLGMARHSEAAYPATSTFASTSTSSPASSSSSEHTGGFFPSVSPFPFAASPFVPTTPRSAGEEDAAAEEKSLVADAEMQDQDQRHSRTALMAKSNSGGPRWCSKCEGWKPDRCHHCRFCQTCVLKMDHHCVWVGTCVGLNNYKPFLLFVTYGTMLAIYICIEAGYESVRFFQDPGDFVSTPGNPDPNIPNSGSHRASPQQLDFGPVAFMLLALLSVFFGLAVGSLAVYHWWLAANNLTTLENMTHSYPVALLPPSPSTSSARYWKPDHLLTRQERNRLRYEAAEINVYDLGWRRNLGELFFGTVTPSRTKGVTVAAVWRAMWPVARTTDRAGEEAGHFFEYDPSKLEKLRELTAELRYGVKSSTPAGEAEQVETDDEYEYTEDEDDNEGGYEVDGHEDDGAIETGNNHADAGFRGKPKVVWFEV